MTREKLIKTFGHFQNIKNSDYFFVDSVSNNKVEYMFYFAEFFSKSFYEGYPECSDFVFRTDPKNHLLKEPSNNFYRERFKNFI